MTLDDTVQKMIGELSLKLCKVEAAFYELQEKHGQSQEKNIELQREVLRLKEKQEKSE